MQPGGPLGNVRRTPRPSLAAPSCTPLPDGPSSPRSRHTVPGRRTRGTNAAGQPEEDDLLVALLHLLGGGNRRQPQFSGPCRNDAPQPLSSRQAMLPRTAQVIEHGIALRRIHHKDTKNTKKEDKANP